jgi:hypothetical protein
MIVSLFAKIKSLWRVEGFNTYIGGKNPRKR